LEVSEGEHECRLAIRLHGDKGTSKTHKLTYEAAPSQFPRDQASTVNHIVANPKTIQDLLDFFANKVNGEITMTCTQRGCSLSSRGDELSDSRQRNNVLQTEVHVPKESFHTYIIGEEVEMTFSLREFRAPVALADHVQCPLEMRLGSAGYPLNMQVKLQGMTAQIFLATSEPDFPKLTNSNRSVSTDTTAITPAVAVPIVNGNATLPNDQSISAAQAQLQDNQLQDNSTEWQTEERQAQDLFRQYDEEQSELGSQIPHATPMQEMPLESSTMPVQPTPSTLPVQQQPMESTPLPPPVKSMQMKPIQAAEEENEMGKSTETGFSSLWHEGDTTFEEEEEEAGKEDENEEDDSATLSENEEFIPGTQNGDSSSNKRPRYRPLL
jgi:Rad9